MLIFNVGVRGIKEGIIEFLIVFNINNRLIYVGWENGYESELCL